MVTNRWVPSLIMMVFRWMGMLGWFEGVEEVDRDSDSKRCASVSSMSFISCEGFMYGEGDEDEDGCSLPLWDHHFFMRFPLFLRDRPLYVWRHRICMGFVIFYDPLGTGCSYGSTFFHAFTSRP